MSTLDDLRSELTDGGSQSRRPGEDGLDQSSTGEQVVSPSRCDYRYQVTL